jgi:sodium/bile acid cotransporter 7
MRTPAVIAFLAALWPMTASADPALDQRLEALIADVEEEVGDVPAIRSDALRIAVASGAPPILLDVRSDQERAVSVLAGAVSDADVIAPGAEVVVYCTVGLRSGITARELRKRGVDALNLRGGILAWIADGGAVVDGNGAPTRRVHVYGRRWNVLPEDFEAVW